MALALRTLGEEADQRVVEDQEEDAGDSSTATAAEDTIPPQANKVESATMAETCDFRKEDQRLRMYLQEIMKDHSTLQKHIQRKAQQELQGATGDKGKDRDQQEESDLISLSLGRSSSSCPKKAAALSKGSRNWKGDDHTHDDHQDLDLGFGFDLNTETPKSGGSTTQSFPSKSSAANSSEAPKEEAGETWPPRKVLTALKRTAAAAGDDEASEHKSRKKARVCVRTRCDTPTMNDGCHWRKYGQKVAKGNPCPRAYYRCTISTSCPVRKQVQRCANDLSVLLTTYEGTHNHPLPMSATAMASTTSAAASMLLSGSSSSQHNTFPNNTTAAASLHGVNFYLDHDSKRKPSYYFSDTSMSSSSPPMVTLDLTSPQNSFLSPLNRFSTSHKINPPIYSSPTLNFSSSEPYPVSWVNGFLGYGSSQPFSYNSNLGTVNSARHTVQNVYSSPHIQNNNSSTLPQHSLPQDAITAATKAITADPRFQSALAAALSSIMGNTDQGSDGHTVIPGRQIGGGNISQRLNSWSDHLYQVPSTLQSTSSTKVNVSASSFLNNTASTNARPGGLMFLPPSYSFSFAGSKEASADHGDNKSSPK